MGRYFIASEENIRHNTLMHYGVKGMKWGKVKAKIDYAKDQIAGKDRPKTESSARVYRHGDNIPKEDLGGHFSVLNGETVYYGKNKTQKTTGKYGTYEGDDSKEQYKKASLDAREKEYYDRKNNAGLKNFVGKTVDTGEKAEKASKKVKEADKKERETAPSNILKGKTKSEIEGLLNSIRKRSKKNT